MLHRLVAGLLLALMTAACAGNETRLPDTTELLDKLPKVNKSPCWQQRQVAAQWSYLHSIEQKKEAVYKAPCDSDPKPEAKTS
jgi:predicted ATPase